MQVSLNDFVIKAVASTLRDVPQANAYWTAESVKFNPTVCTLTLEFYMYIYIYIYIYKYIHT
jgi:hypothetical protein